MAISTPDELELLSVGIDVGSSTSHLVFSNLILRKDNHSSSRKYEVTEREIKYEGRIIDTPLIDKNTINIDELVAFFKEEYSRAGITPEMVNTGAVIVTGETAKKSNAAKIVELLSNDTGKFIAATAGPNFESMLAAFGSGATNRSKEKRKNVLSVDIGGGTSNMAISSNGNVVSTACINVGGRLLAFEEDGMIWRIDEPAQIIIEKLGMSYKVGDKIPVEDIRKIATKFAEVLIEVCVGPTQTDLAKLLMMTTDLDFSIPIDEVAFSGGVGELYYGEQKSYRDMGVVLAEEIKKLSHKFTASIIEPENKIRATVIGAGAYSLSISGSTCYVDDSVKFPLRNIPVMHVNADRTKLSIDHIKEEVAKSFERFDIEEGSEVVALYFKDPVRVAYDKLKLFSQAIELALPNSVSKNVLIILIFEKDIANSVGNVTRRETSIKENLISLDELQLEEGDWIDIGAPLISGEVFPVTVKSLVFNKKIIAE
ncbi:MAG: ethanolamine ammonia-lyase reactivating factor EutA [Candidatus Heimdallarchaeota archaeon]|nr:ethanolamine ammonia-lyase reactivating factor EutA [Candidatus Heimdallarchaeota archaeon]